MQSRAQILMLSRYFEKVGICGEFLKKKIRSSGFLGFLLFFRDFCIECEGKTRKGVIV